jgi:hypothetical protein
MQPLCHYVLCNHHAKSEKRLAIKNRGRYWRFMLTEMDNSASSFERRFWAKVHKTDGCWEWTAYRLKNGYGRMKKKTAELVLAHRISWEIHNGPIPNNLQVLHHCDNPSCVNPDHLFLGTVKDNMLDCARKGRRPKGENHCLSKLTEKQVHEIKMYLAEGVILRIIAKYFSVSRQCISNIKLGITWRDSMRLT